MDCSNFFFASGNQNTRFFFLEFVQLDPYRPGIQFFIYDFSIIIIET